MSRTLFVEAIDQGAPEYFVQGPAKVERLSRDVARVSYWVERNGSLIVPLHIVWGYDSIMAGEPLYAEAFDMLRRPWHAPSARRMLELH